MASYALEMSGSTLGSRLHSLSIFLRDDKVTFWYADASGVVRTPRPGTPVISLIDDFEKVAAIFIALSYCSAEALGAFPEAIIRPPQEYPASFPPTSLTGYTINLSESNVPCEVILEKFVFSQYVIFGRRTTVYQASSRATALSGRALVVKISLQFIDRQSEVELVEKARKCGVRYLPEILKAKDMWKLSDGIRQYFLFEGTALKWDDRVLRCIVLPYYIPLSVQLLRKPDSIKTMARQMLRCEFVFPYVR